ncbi:MAG: ATP-binding cassette domain-containing protein [Myxococcales bacterium]|nr:ATP-binding cassette domain-containing protein [Myxococcales bacterium]
MIHVDNLTKVYQGNPKPAVAGISFDVHAGEVLGFVGPNGAGKTTTMKILVSFLAPTGGQATVAGYDVYEQALEARKHIGYLPEDTPLYKDMTVLEYLEFVGRVRGLSKEAFRKSLRRVAEQCAIGPRLGHLIGELSRGFRQRVGLAQALLHDPDVLILDEPTSGLDPNQIVEIRNIIKEFGREKTVIFSTHILPEVQITCSRVIVISDGKIVADDSPTELGHILEKQRGMELVVEFAGGSSEVDAARAALEKVSGVVSIKPFIDAGEEQRPGRFLVGTAVGSDLRGEIFRAASGANAQLLEISRHAPLEDVFRHMTRSQTAAGAQGA